MVNDEVKVELKTSLDTSKLSSMTRYFNFLNYALLAGCVYCISMILASVKENNVRKRTIISSYNYKKFNRIVLLTNGILILVMWIFYMVLSGILFKELLISTNGLAYILNALMFSICSLTIGFLLEILLKIKCHRRNCKCGGARFIVLMWMFCAGRVYA